MSSACQDSGNFSRYNCCNNCNSGNLKQIPDRVQIQDDLRRNSESPNSILTSPELMVQIVNIYGDGEIEVDLLNKLMAELLTEEGYNMMLILSEIGEETNVRFKYDVELGDGIFYVPQSD